MIYKISGAKESGDMNPRREWDLIVTARKLKTAKELAIKLTSQWYEIEIIGKKNKDSDIEYHSYWRMGKLEIDMGL